MHFGTWSSLALAASAMMLAGCANPILAIDAPGYSLQRSRAPTTDPATMEEAKQKLNHFHANYYEAILAQTGQAQSATTGLVWLGTLVAGMAAGNVHRDGILGASLIGGTTYGLSRMQLDARRIQIWTEGLKALDCAKEASLPLDIGESRRQQLVLARTALRQRATEVVTAQDALKAALTTVLETTAAPEAAAAQQIVVRTDAALASANTTLNAADELLKAADGGELSMAVDRIHSRVTQAMGDIAVDVSSVKQMVAGLGGFANVLAPGTGIEARLSGAFSNYDKAGKGPGSQANVTGDLTKAVSDLQAALAKLTAAQQRVAQLLTTVNVAAVSAALKKCDVAGVAAPITLTPAERNFDEKSAATKGFAISGGTPPYTVTALDALPEGVSLVWEGGFAESAQVKVTAAAPAGDIHLQVSDSGTVKRKQQFVVHIAPKAADAAPPAAPGAPAPAADGAGTKPIATAQALASATPTMVNKAWASLAAAMTKAGFSKKLGSVEITVSSAVLDAGRLKVLVRCSPPGAGLVARDVRERLATADKAAVKQLMDAKALDGDLTQIDLTPSAPCVKP